MRHEDPDQRSKVARVFATRTLLQHDRPVSLSLCIDEWQHFSCGAPLAVGIRWTAAQGTGVVTAKTHWISAQQ